MKFELKEGNYCIIKCVHCKQVMMIMDNKVIGRVELRCNRCGAVSYFEKLYLEKNDNIKQLSNKKNKYVRNRQGMEFLPNEE